MLNRKNSLFAILTRQPWWVSVALALGLFASTRLFLPDLMAFFVALPFSLMAGYISWQQLRLPSPTKVAKKLAALRALPTEAFCTALVEGYRRDGHAVEAATKGADYALRKAGKLTLLACRRWKAAQTGMAPLKELAEAKAHLKARECLYATTGEISEPARKFASENNIRFLSDFELVTLAGHVLGKP